MTTKDKEFPNIFSLNGQTFNLPFYFKKDVVNQSCSKMFYLGYIDDKEFYWIWYDKDEESGMYSMKISKDYYSNILEYNNTLFFFHKDFQITKEEFEKIKNEIIE